MPVVCLYFPQLRIDLALLAHPEIRGRPVVLLDRPGPEGAVTARSFEAALLGVHPAMKARAAYDRAPGAVFLRDTGEKVQAVLGEMAEEIRNDGAGVPDVGPDSVAVHTGRLVPAFRLLAAARVQEAGLTVRVGRGASVQEACAAAKAARGRSRAQRQLARRRAS